MDNKSRVVFNGFNSGNVNNNNVNDGISKENGESYFYVPGSLNGRELPINTKFSSTKTSENVEVRFGSGIESRVNVKSGTESDMNGSKDSSPFYNPGDLGDKSSGISLDKEPNKFEFKGVPKESGDSGVFYASGSLNGENKPKFFEVPTGIEGICRLVEIEENEGEKSRGRGGR